ncbi:hypothetical protein VN97_g4951 [Penicillium thymicola]|uniref:Uncharacterized protein n=1 Tax=Penicillium thymicola TaxID=293382 RepID=A0AAI9TJN9_PENTH|nr:hypothetical protein VN97_g4951 [Penicillium thymicola]
MGELQCAFGFISTYDETIFLRQVQMASGQWVVEYSSVTYSTDAYEPSGSQGPGSGLGVGPYHSKGENCHPVLTSLTLVSRLLTHITRTHPRKPHAGELVVGWVTTSESLLLYVFIIILSLFPTDIPLKLMGPPSIAVRAVSTPGYITYAI